VPAMGGAELLAMPPVILFLIRTRFESEGVILGQVGGHEYTMPHYGPGLLRLDIIPPTFESDAA